MLSVLRNYNDSGSGSWRKSVCWRRRWEPEAVRSISEKLKHVIHQFLTVNRTWASIHADSRRCFTCESYMLRVLGLCSKSPYSLTLSVTSLFTACNCVSLEAHIDFRYGLSHSVNFSHCQLSFSAPAIFFLWWLHLFSEAIIMLLPEFKMVRCSAALGCHFSTVLFTPPPLHLLLC